MSIETKILDELSGESFVSGEAISARLGITRSAIWKHIGALRRQGFVIEASPRRGYRLAGLPDKLLPALLQPALAHSLIGGRVVHFQEAGSTADEARLLVEAGAPEGTVVTAEAQTQGRGRMGRSWETPAGTAIALSVILYPDISPTQAPLLSLATALAARRAIATVVGKETGAAAAIDLKWPNDIYLAGNKLGGVLVEMSAELDRVRWVISSIGLNVNNDFAGTSLGKEAISLSAFWGRRFSRSELAVAILEELGRVYGRNRSGSGLEAAARGFQEHDLLQGQRVKVSAPEGVVEGTAAGIDSEGRLLLHLPGGSIRPLFSGEVSVRRQARF